MPTSTDDQYRPSRGSGPKRLGPMVPRVQNQTREDDGADERDENQKHPPAGSVAIMQSPNRNPEARQEDSQEQNHGKRSISCTGKHDQIDDVGHDTEKDHEQSPEPILRPYRP